jgi:alpha-tubulin suppressor-like RCC1 family protein
MEPGGGFLQQAQARPMVYRSPHGARQAAAPQDLKAAQSSRARLDALAGRLLADDTFFLIDTARVSPAKQARALRARMARFGASGGPVVQPDSGDEEEAALARGGGARRRRGGDGDDEDDDDDGDGDRPVHAGSLRAARFGGVSLSSQLGNPITDAASALRRGARLRVSPIRGSGGGDGSGGLVGSASSAAASSSSPAGRSPHRLQLAPLPGRSPSYAHKPSARGPAIDASSSEISGALVEWRAPTRLYVWGGGPKGQLGVGALDGRATSTRMSVPVRIQVGTPIRVSCGRDATAIVDSQRRLWTCGDGWLGRGVKERTHVPVLLPTTGGPMSIVEVACGHGFFVACTVDGAVVVWGENLTMAALAGSSKEFRKDGLGIGRAAAPHSPAAAAASSSSGGGAAGAESAPASSPRVPAVAGAGLTAHGHPLGLTPGELTRVPAPKFVPGFFGGPTPASPSPSGPSGDVVISVAAGEGHMVAMTAAGHVFTWGAGTSGACGHGTLEHCYSPRRIRLRPRRVRDPTATPWASTAIGEDAAAEEDEGLGSGRRGSFGSLMSSGASMAAPASSAGGRSPTGADKGGGGGGGGGTTSAAEEGRQACSIAAGAHHTAVLALDGTVHVFGFAEGGRLGLGLDRAVAVSRPTQLRSLPTLVAVACGDAHTLLLSADGRVYACGDNVFGACGINTRLFGAAAAAAADRALPGFGSGGEGGLQGMGAGALTDDKVVAEARVLAPRQVFTPAFANIMVTRIMAGARHSAAVSVDGKMWMWGLNTEGCCGNGDDNTTPEPTRVARFKELRVVQASLGGVHTGAIVSRGRVGNANTALASLDQDDGGGGGATALEPPLSLKLRRARRQALNIRKKAVAYAASMRRRQARRARRKALRKAVTTGLEERERAGMGGMGGGRGHYRGAIAVMQSATDAEAADAAAAAAAAAAASSAASSGGGYDSDGYGSAGGESSYAPGPSAFSRRYANAAAARRARGMWELDPDDAEYGKNAAAYLIQTMCRKWIYTVRRRKRAAVQAAAAAAQRAAMAAATRSSGAVVGSRAALKQNVDSPAAGRKGAGRPKQHAVNMSGEPGEPPSGSRGGGRPSSSAAEAAAAAAAEAAAAAAASPANSNSAMRARHMQQLHALGFTSGGPRGGAAAL